MLVTTHGIIGGFIATQIPQPLINIPLAILAHFAADRIPHCDFGTNFKKRRKEINFLLGLLDLSGAFLFPYLIFQQGKPFNPVIWGAVLASILPDLLELPPLFFNCRPFPLDKIEGFHSKRIHRRLKFPWGLVPQILIILLILLLN